MPNMLYNDSIKGFNMWEDAHGFFVKKKNKKNPESFTLAISSGL